MAGVISESTYERLDRVVADTLGIRYRLPRFPLVPVAHLLASRLTAVDIRDVSISRAVVSLTIPIVFVSGECDPRMTPDVGERRFSLAARGLGHIVVPGADHAECWTVGQPKYGEYVLELVRDSLSKPLPTGARGQTAT